MVALNVLGSSEEDEVLRVYRRAVSLWCSHVAEEAAFGSAAVYANGKLSQVEEANCVLGNVEAGAAGAIEAYFGKVGTRPLACYLPGKEDEAAWPGIQMQRLALYRQCGNPAGLPVTHPELTIIPARASFRHAQAVAAMIRPTVPADQAAEAMMCHLDDPHVDAVLALRGDEAAGFAAVLSTGESGVIMELFVPEAMRGRGYGKPLAAAILDLCQRSRFKHTLCVLREDEPGSGFAKRLGFERAGEVVMGMAR